MKAQKPFSLSLELGPACSLAYSVLAVPALGTPNSSSTKIPQRLCKPSPAAAT